MTTQTREWIEAAGNEMASLPGRWLWVEDGHVGHRTPLAPRAPGSRAIRVALDDYVAGYDAGERGVEIAVNWRLYQDGKVIAGARYTFESR